MENTKKTDKETYEEVYQDFINRTNVIVGEYLKEHAGRDCHKFMEEKVINDPIWGCIKYYGWEIAIIDTPLFQRLRDIYQVGLGVFTYPAARHSRFEHSLGVVAIADKMIQSLRNQDASFLKISDIDVQEVRLAALLHDIGHCFYSHLSETFYGTLPEFTDLQRYFRLSFKVTPKPHEMFSYLVINTPRFINFLQENDILPQKLVSEANGLELLMKRIGNMIIGVPNKGRYKGQDRKKTYAYLTSIINGDIDADKLDYIRRDSYTSGLPLTFDVERLLYKISVKENTERDEYQLVVDMAGINVVEEITFSKLMLNHYIYHHQKVLATEVMAKDIALALYELGKVKHPCDFLRYTDKTIEALANNTEIPFNHYGGVTVTLGYLVRRVKDRYLPKRCFEINSRVLESASSDPEMEDKQRQAYTKECLAKIEQAESVDEKEAILTSYATDVFEFTQTVKKQVSEYTQFIAEFNSKSYKEYTKWIRKEVAEEIANIYNSLQMPFPKAGITIFDVHMVIPKSIDEQMTFSTPIVYRNAEGHTTTDMLSYTKNWANAFNSNKWSGYVFVSPHIDITIAFMATKKVILRHMPNVTLNNPEEFVKRIDEALLDRIDRNR